MREIAVEDHLTERMEMRNGVAIKVVSPGFNGLPDRLLLRPVEEVTLLDRGRSVTLRKELVEEILGRFIRFAELKAPGKKPKPHQARVHKKLRDLGFTVDVIDTKEKANQVTARMLG